MRRFVFIVALAGYGADEDSAWRDAVESFSQDPGSPTEAREVIEECGECGHRLDFCECRKGLQHP